MESTVSFSICEALCGPPLVSQPEYHYAVPLRAARRPIDARRRAGGARRWPGGARGGVVRAAAAYAVAS